MSGRTFALFLRGWQICHLWVIHRENDNCGYGAGTIADVWSCSDSRCRGQKERDKLLKEDPAMSDAQPSKVFMFDP